MITVRNLIVAGVCVLAVPGTAQAQNSLLGKLLGALGQPAGQARTSAGRPSPTQLTVQPTTEQSAALHNAVLVKQNNSLVARDVQEASSLIERLAGTGAWATNTGAWNAFNREAVTPKTWMNGMYMHLPRDGDPYHDPRFCLDVLRVTDYSKPAANALSFRVYYISPQSQRARNQMFTLLHSTEGPWLVKEIGQVG